MPRLRFVSFDAARGTLALALAAASLLACERSPSEPSGSLRVATLAKASVSAAEPVRRREVVRDAARYATVWRELWGDREVGRPEVDFGREMVVVASHSVDACLGEVDIEGIRREGSRTVVSLGESRPHLCLCAAGETTFHVVKVPRLPGPDEFAVHPIRSRCG